MATGSVPRWAKWTGGCLLAVLVAPFLAVLWWYYISQPLITRSSRSPDGRLEVHLERTPFGTVEPRYYSITGHTGWWPFETSCAIGGIDGWRAEDYVRFAWPRPDTLEIRYGVSRYQRGPTGEAYVVGRTGACPGLRASARRDRSLDSAATKGNLSNHDYASPPTPNPFGNGDV